MQEIHLIQKDPELTPWPVEKGSKMYESGYWSLSLNRASDAIGAKIFFHAKRADPSFFGGTITDVRAKEDEHDEVGSSSPFFLHESSEV